MLLFANKSLGPSNWGFSRTLYNKNPFSLQYDSKLSYSVGHHAIAGFSKTFIDMIDIEFSVCVNSNLSFVLHQNVNLNPHIVCSICARKALLFRTKQTILDFVSYSSSYLFHFKRNRFCYEFKVLILIERVLRWFWRYIQEILMKF